MAEPASGWLLWSILCACALLSMLIEEYTAAGKVVSGVVLAMASAGVLAYAGVIPTACAVYDTIWETVMPMGAALYLLEADIGRLMETGAAALAAFALGALGTLCGTYVAWQVTGSLMGAGGSVVAAALCASYIGGSVNFAAVVQALKLPDPSLAASAMAIDNIAMAIFLTVLFSIPVASVAAARLPPRSEKPHESGESSGVAPLSPSEALPNAAMPSSGSHSTEAVARAPHSSHSFLPPHIRFAASLSSACICCAVGRGFATWLCRPELELAFMTAAACLAATAVPRLVAAIPRAAHAESRAPPQIFSGSSDLAGFFMMLFFTSIGAASGHGIHPSSAPLAAFVALQLSIHIAIVLGGGFVFKLPLDVVIIASNANVGGSATAAAMAAARGWKHLLQTAMVLGALGYCLGTGLGLWMHSLLA